MRAWHRLRRVTRHGYGFLARAIFESTVLGSEYMKKSVAIWTALLLVAAAPAAAQWKPERPIEIIAPSGPGGTPGRTARVRARILTQHKLVDVPVNVVNKAGGSGTLGLTYLNSHPGDAHYIIIGTSASIS